MRKAFVVGRHDAAVGFDVVKAINVTFTGKVEELVWIEGQALQSGASCVIMQNMPAIQLRAWMEFQSMRCMDWGIVVSKPAPAAGKTRTPVVITLDADFSAVQSVEAALRIANPRASLINEDGRFYVEAEAPREFVFSHIDWF